MSFFLSKKIRYFVAVMEERNLSSAAEKLHITRSPLGKSIADLEMNIGDKLFLRKGNVLVPTESTTQLYNRIKPIYDSLMSIEESFSYNNQKNQLRLYVDECYPRNLFDALRSLEYIKSLNLKIERKPFNEATLMKVITEKQSAFLTLRKNHLHDTPGYSFKDCKTKKIYFAFANNQSNKNKSIEKMIKSHSLIKGGVVSDEYFLMYISSYLGDITPESKLISEDIGLTAMLNLISNDEAVSFIPESFLKYCGTCISTMLVDQMTITPKLFGSNSSSAYFEKIIQYIDNN